MRNPFRKSAGRRAGQRRYGKIRFRRHHALFLAPIALATMLLGAVTQNAEGLAAAWRDPAALLGKRSPGQRDPGALYSTKPEHVLARTLPAERVLPGIRERFAPEELPLIDGFAFDGLPPDAFAFGERVLPMGRESFSTEGLPLIEEFVDGEPALMAFAPMPGGNNLSLPPPPAGGGSNPPPQTPPPGVSSPVPEPSTWLISIVGLFAVGGAMRRRNRQTLNAARPATA